MLFKGGFGCEFVEVPNFDGLVMGASRKNVTFGMDSQRFNRVGVSLVYVSNWIDLVEGEFLLFLDDVMFSLHFKIIDLIIR